jgi:hypothetical protein
MNLSGSKSMSIQVQEPGADKLGGQCGCTGGEAVLALLSLLALRRHLRRS